MESHAIIYPEAPNRVPSADYMLRIDGKDVFVNHSDSGSYAIFSITGLVKIEIETVTDFDKVTIRPLRLNVTPFKKERTISFTLNTPGTISIEIDDDLKSPLFIFAMPPELSKPSPTDPRIRYFEAGKVHEPGIITLKSDESIYIEGGAVVYGLVDSEDSHNINIHGRGILDGNKYRNVWKKEGRQSCLVRFAGCSDITLEGVTFVDGPSWTIVPNGCSNISITDCNIITCVSTGDGIDIVGCTDVNVKRCFVRADDDCVVLKAVDYFSEKGLTNVERVRVSDCVFWNGKPGNAIEIGYETRCDYIRDISFVNCDIIHSEFEGWQSGAALSIHNGDRAVVSDILYENIRVEDCQEKLFDLKVLHTNYSKDIVRGQIKNITFKNISVIEGQFPVSILRGHAEWKNNKLIENVRFENLIIHNEKIKNSNQARMVVELSSEINFT